MKNLKQFSFSQKAYYILLGFVKFMILIGGFYFIGAFVESRPQAYSDIGVPAGAVGAALEFLFLSIIWLILWYIIIWLLYFRNKRKENHLNQLANFTGLILPPIALAMLCLWLFVLNPLHYEYKKNLRIKRQDQLSYCIAHVQREEAIHLLEEYSYENFRVLNSDSTFESILVVAAKHDQVVFEFLLYEFDNQWNYNIQGNLDAQGNCIFCHIEEESLALKALNRMYFSFTQNYSFHKPVCNKKDILIYFIERKWNNCLEVYLQKFQDAVNHTPYKGPYSRMYNCQIELEPDFLGYRQLKTVNPHDYTTDIKTISILNKFKFQDEK